MNHATINRQRRDLEDILVIRKANVRALMDQYLDAIADNDKQAVMRYRGLVDAAQVARHKARKALADFNKENHG